MAKNKKLRKQIEKYAESLEVSLSKGDPLDADYFHGYDQALRNVAWGLKRILEATK